MALTREQRKLEQRLQQIEEQILQHPLCRLAAILMAHPQGTVEGDRAIAELLPLAGLDPKNLPGPIGQIILSHILGMNAARSRVQEQQIRQGISGIEHRLIDGGCPKKLAFWHPIENFAILPQDIQILRGQKDQMVNYFLLVAGWHELPLWRYGPGTSQWRVISPSQVLSLSSCYGWATMDAVPPPQTPDNLWAIELGLHSPVAGEGSLEIMATKTP